MNLIDAEDEITRLRERVTQLEGQARLIRFVGGVIAVATIGLIVDAIGEALHL